MIYRALSFAGWFIASILVLTGIVGLFTQPAISLILILWGLLFAPPLWRMTIGYGLKVNILGRLAVFVFSTLIGAAVTPPLPSTARSPQPSVQVSAASPSPSVSPQAIASSQATSVVSVGDGDTIRVSQGNTKLTVRLACLDAPESDQPFGKEAAQELKNLLPAGQAVELRVVDTDKYKRTVAEVFVNGRSVNLQMVQGGYAVAYRSYLKNCNAAQYLQAEDTAKAGRLAFWSQENPVMPWEWRQGKRSVAASPSPSPEVAAPSPAPAAPTSDPKPITTPSPQVDPDQPVRQAVSGSCDCPYDTDKRGHTCGRRSAYSRPGGASPICYERDKQN